MSNYRDSFNDRDSKQLPAGTVHQQNNKLPRKVADKVLPRKDVATWNNKYHSKQIRKENETQVHTILTKMSDDTINESKTTYMFRPSHNDYSLCPM